MRDETRVWMSVSLSFHLSVFCSLSLLSLLPFDVWLCEGVRVRACVCTSVCVCVSTRPDRAGSLSLPRVLVPAQVAVCLINHSDSIIDQGRLVHPGNTNSGSNSISFRRHLQYFLIFVIALTGRENLAVPFVRPFNWRPATRGPTDHEPN